MKYILIIWSMVLYNYSFGQITSIKTTNHWKLYDINAGNLFQYSIDTVKTFPCYELDDDSIHEYLAELSELSSDDPPRWMGAHIATYDMDGRMRKVEISLYGGFFYDEASKKHYQIPDNKIDDWLSYIRRSFMAIHKEPNRK